MSSTEIKRLLEDVTLELQKSGNEDATHLIDRIDRILSPKPMQPEILGEIQVFDFVPEFIEKLVDQLKLDHNRWGNTWLNRPKEGQESRTKARYDDYFDMFWHTGTPVPWLKVVGGALICWIRDNHPELCPDVNEVIADDMKAMGFKPGEDEPVKDTGMVSGMTGRYHPPEDEVIGISVSPDGVKDIRLPVISSKTPVPTEQVEERDGLLVLKDKPVEEMTTKELVESEPPILHQAELLGHTIESAALTNPIAHIVGEKIERTGLGKLSYSPRSGKDGKIILDSVVFTKANAKEYPNEVVTKLGTCDKDGRIIPTSKAVGVLGRVSSNGQYRFSLVNGVGPDDVIFVSYTYEYANVE